MAIKHLQTTWILGLALLQVIGCAKDSTRSAPKDAAIELADDTAGKPCKRNADCKNGRCATELHLYGPTNAIAAPGGYCTLDCSTAVECGEHGVCSVPADEARGECLGDCAQASDCRSGYVCVGASAVIGIHVAGTCQPQPETDQISDGAIGRSCDDDAQCGGGECIRAAPLGTPLPGNYCTGRCLNDSQCGQGGACMLIAGSSDAGHCWQPCTADTDCTRAGYRCVSLQPSFNACYPAPETLPDNATGIACTVDQDCAGASATCMTQLPFGSFLGYEVVPAPGGYCTQACSLDAQCGAGARCIQGGPGGGLCLASCMMPSDCRQGYVCLADGRDHSATDSVCVPATSTNPGTQ